MGLRKHTRVNDRSDKEGIGKEPVTTDLKVSLSRMFSETSGGGGAASAGAEVLVPFTSMGAGFLGGAGPASVLLCCEYPWNHKDN